MVCAIVLQLPGSAGAATRLRSQDTAVRGARVPVTTQLALSSLGAGAASLWSLDSPLQQTGSLSPGFRIQEVLRCATLGQFLTLF